MFRALSRAAVVALLCAVAAGNPAFAKSKTKTSSPNESLTLLTGPKTGTYFAIGNDIAKAAKKAKVEVQVKPSDGSIDNIRRINSNENASLGIVQSDILGFMSRSQNQDTMRMGSNLRMVLPLYREEVHVLVRDDIRTFADLAGKKIIIGEDGSGHMLTARNLFSMMDIAPQEFVYTSAPEGVVELLERKVDALIYVGGKPVKIFQNLEKLGNGKNERYEPLLKQLHFLPLNDPRMLQEYETAEITPKDYDFISETIPTISVTAVLVAYDYSDSKTHRSRCKELGELTSALSKHLPDLQAKGHPKWKEVKAGAKLPIWKRDTCAWPSAPKSAKSPKPAPKPPQKQNLSKDLVDTIRQR